VWYDEEIFLAKDRPYNVATFVILVAGLGLLGAGFFMRSRNAHLVRAAGWSLNGFYWATQALRLYTYEDRDLVNAVFAGFGTFFFNWLAYHELISYQRSEDPKALKFMAGMVFVTSAVYFTVLRVKPIADWLIVTVAGQTVWLLRLFNQDVILQGDSICYAPGPCTGFFGPTVNIILACTAIQSMMIFIGALAVVPDASMKKRTLGLLVTVPPIYALNLARNASIIWMWAGQGWSFSFAHNVIGKGGSLLALVVLAFITFQVVPQLYDAIVGLLDLPKRNGPLEVYWNSRKGPPKAPSATSPPSTAPAFSPGPEPTPDESK
jgi:archaeosortase A (PGF-CTERM-specific)